MERSRRSCLFILGVVAALLSQNLVSSSNLEDQKNLYFPSIGSPPVVLSPPFPSIGSPPIDPSSPPIVYNTSPPPSHGSGGSTPPVHHTPTPTPSHGGSGSGGGHHHGRTSPPANCGNPTPPRHVDPSPPTHHNPSPSGGGGGSGSTPAVPSPAPPTYNYSPPPSGGGSTPAVPSPIVLPPTTPGIPMIPSPPFDPNSPPIGGTCDFWRNHPGFIWGLFGWYGTTIGSAFGVGTLPATGANLNLVQALSNTRTDGIGALYREGTASLLNSMVNKNFPYTTSHVKDSFMAAVGSNKAAAAQARVFKLANEGHMKKRA